MPSCRVTVQFSVPNDIKNIVQPEHFSFIYCVEHSVKDGQYMNWEACFQQTGFNSKAVIDCYNSGYGIKVGFTMLLITIISYLRIAKHRLLTDNLAICIIPLF